MSQKEFEVTVERVVKASVNDLVHMAIPITIHPCKVGVIVVNSHGLGGSKDGYNDKYVKIAKLLQSLKVGTVVRYQHSVTLEQKIEKAILFIETLRSVLNYVLDNAESMCNSENPVIYLASFSAGASISAAVAYEYPQVKKTLLIAPSADVGVENLKKGLSLFKGELYITLGENDHIISPETAMPFSKWATKAKLRKVVTVPDCDYQFTREINGRILSKAYLWVFKGDETYPSPEGGIKLY